MSSRFDPWDLADSGSRLHRTLSPAELPRVGGEGRRLLTPVNVTLTGATNVAGLATLTGSVRGTIETTCQRCLQPMTIEMAIDVKLALVENESRLDELPADLDPLIVGDGESTSLADLVAEELLLALPLVPAHEATAEAHGVCRVAHPRPTSHGAGRQKPFADLANLLNSSVRQVKE